MMSECHENTEETRLKLIKCRSLSGNFIYFYFTDTVLNNRTKDYLHRRILSEGE